MRGKLLTDKLFKQLLFFVILATAGIVINFMPFPLHFRVDFLFGGICALIAVYVLPPLPGIITAAIIALPTFTLWHHFFGIIMYTLEAVAVTILLRKTRLHMLTCATITWFFLLPPIIYLNMQLSGMFFPAAIRLFLIKYTLNGVFNAAIAAAIIFIFKLKPTEEKHAEMEITASEAAINAFIIVTIIPLLIFTLLDSRIISGTVFTQLQNRHDSLKKILSLEVNNWHKEQLKTLGQIADLAGQTNNFEHLDNLLENFIKNQSEFSRFHFSDLEGKSLCCSPAHDDHDFCFATFNGKLQAFHHSVIDTEKSLFSGVQTDQHLASTPVIIIAQPTFAAGKIKGVVTGVLAVSSLEKRLQPLIDQNITVKIIDENSKIVYSSNSGKIGQPYESKLHLANSIHNGKLTIIPPEEQMVTSSRYRHSTLIFDNRLNTPANWNMVIEEPLKKYVDTLFDLSFTQFLNISLLIFIMVIMSGFIRRFFSTPLRELSDYTNEIAKTGFCGSSLPTPTSKVYEINRLIENFSAAMDKISESQNHEKQKNQELQNLNDELKKRMKELRETKLIADQAE